MLGGYTGRFLWIDLTTRETQDETADESLLRDFIGGYGLAARILYSRQSPGVDPLGPSNILAFVTGPLTGTPTPTGTRWAVACKSPLTGTWGDANAGGFFGPTLKFSGYDALFFTGASPEPTYLLVENGRGELRDAGQLWGRDTYETEDMLKSELGKDIEVACIGPAAEKLSLISCIIHRKGRAAGRSGVGAVMGSKRLKAVAVRGTKSMQMANPKLTRELRRKYIREIRSGVGSADVYREMGTPSYVETGVFNGDSPTKNWSGIGAIDFPNPEPIGFNTLMRHRTKRAACWHCPIACWGLVSMSYDGQEIQAHQPQYETGCAFGSNLLNDHLGSIIYANDLCNRYGLDTISSGATIAFAFECFERGLLSEHDTDGIELTWGNHQAIVKMLHRLARRQGFGDVLADGVRAAASKIGKGSEEYAIHIRGQELPMHDPRFEPGLGLIYKIDATPARHTQAGQYIKPVGLGHDMPDFGGGRAQQPGHGKHMRLLSGICHAMNASGVCLFGYQSTNMPFVGEFLTAVTGVRYGLDELLNVGERIANIRQAFNVREGINVIRESVPKRAYGIPPLEKGPTAGITVEIDMLLREHLDEMDWTLDAGKPRARKLIELGLQDVARDLWGAVP